MSIGCRGDMETKRILKMHVTELQKGERSSKLLLVGI